MAKYKMDVCVDMHMEYDFKLIVESASLNARFGRPELQNKDSAPFLVICWAVPDRLFPSRFGGMGNSNSAEARYW